MVLIIISSSSIIIQGHRKTWTGFETDLLEQYVFPQIETFEQETVSRVTFMQDGAAPPFQLLCDWRFK